MKKTGTEKQEKEEQNVRNLLEIVYAVEDREAAETLLSRANLGGVVISTEQYDEEILSVLASEQTLLPEIKQLHHHRVIASCEEKRRTIYRVATSTEPEHVLCSFPFREGEEWYIGPGKTMYLSVQAHDLSDEQISWLAASTDIVDWKYDFELTQFLRTQPGS